MSESFDREKIIDCMFDPITSEILAELEDGKKQCSPLALKFSMSEPDILKRLDYLIEFKFLFKTTENISYLPIMKNLVLYLKIAMLLMVPSMVWKKWIVI